MGQTNYTGSQKTYDICRVQIAKRWGKQAGEDYNPLTDLRTYKNWIEEGYQVKTGAIAVKSHICIKYKNVNGQVEGYLKKINLFYKADVKKI